MVYCSKCGKKNEDGAEFCSKCGASLTEKKEHEKEWDKRCEEDCTGGKRGAPYFWGIIIILIGLLIIFEVVLKNIKGLPASLSWVYDFQFGWIIALVIALAFIIWGIRILARK